MKIKIKLLILTLSLLLSLPLLGEEGWFGDPAHTRKIWFSAGAGRDLDSVLADLIAEFRFVKFEAGPSHQGFFAVGSNVDLDAIAQKLNQSVRKTTVGLPVRKGLDPEKARRILKEHFPDVRIEVVPPVKVLVVEGSAGAIDLVRELLAEG